MKGWHYFGVLKLSALLGEISSKYLTIFIVGTAFILLQYKKTPECEKIIWKKTDFCIVLMLSEDTEKIEFNQYQVSEKSPFCIMEVFNVY